MAAQRHQPQRATLKLAALATALGCASCWVPTVLQRRSCARHPTSVAKAMAARGFTGQVRRIRSPRHHAALSLVTGPSPAAWWGGHAVGLAVYVANWMILAKIMPRGVPKREIIDKQRTPRLFTTYVVGALLELLVVYVLPIPAMALEGTWQLGWTLFSPIMVMTVINIWLEGIFRRKKLITTVYSNTGASGLWRLLSYCAVFNQLQTLPLPWFKAVAVLGIILHIGYIVVFTPMIAAGLDLGDDDAKVITTNFVQNRDVE